MSRPRFSDVANPAADSPVAGPRWTRDRRAMSNPAFAQGREYLLPVKIIEKEINRLFPPFVFPSQPPSKPLTNFSGAGGAAGLCSKFPESQRLSGADGVTAAASPPTGRRRDGALIPGC